eukprot:m.94031 g.94031  ORF g.94031 m.94031 type:complete len:132 (+) comp36808_c0_seq1:1204-1599(+)
MKSTDSNYLERHNDNVGLFEEEAKRKKLQNESATWEETDKSGELEKNSGETEGLKREFAQEPKEQYESEEEHCAASGKTSLAGPTDSPLELFQGESRPTNKMLRLLILSALFHPPIFKKKVDSVMEMRSLC